MPSSSVLRCPSPGCANVGGNVVCPSSLLSSLLLIPVLGCHSVRSFVHLLSSLLATCPSPCLQNGTKCKNMAHLTLLSHSPLLLSHFENGCDVSAYFMLDRTKMRALLLRRRKICLRLQKGAGLSSVQE